MRKFLWSLFFLLYTTFLSASDIAVVTIAYGEDYQKSVRLGVENKRAYCQRHGYDFIYCEESLDLSRHIYWSKILLVLKTFENPNYKWVVWLDADTLIMNQDIPLEDLIDEKYHFLIAKDWNGINTGVFFIRNSEWSQKLLTQAYGHTEFLSHIWPEQMSIAAELQQPEFGSHTKIFPQRVFNSYSIEKISSLTSTYQPGDFLLHFADQKGKLNYLFDNYFPLVLNDRHLVTLDQYLSYYGFQLSPVHSSNNEGYMSQTQKEQIKTLLSHYPNIESILEIGLNGGHSAENFFQCCKNLKQFASFDICWHAYTPVAVEYLSRKYKKKFEFIKGDSALTIPEYTEMFPNQTFDLIYIDGNHSYDSCTQDILNCQKLANKETILLIDDYVVWIREAIDALQAKGVIEIMQVHSSHDKDGERVWVEARYLF